MRQKKGFSTFSLIFEIGNILDLGIDSDCAQEKEFLKCNVQYLKYRLQVRI
jgi:hypothetical protein